MLPFSVKIQGWGSETTNYRISQPAPNHFGPNFAILAIFSHIFHKIVYKIRKKTLQNLEFCLFLWKKKPKFKKSFKFSLETNQNCWERLRDYKLQSGIASPKLSFLQNFAFSQIFFTKTLQNLKFRQFSGKNTEI